MSKCRALTTAALGFFLLAANAADSSTVQGAAARGRPHYDDVCLACLCRAVGKGGACRVDTRVRCLFLDSLGPFCITRPFWLDAGLPVLPGDHPDLPGAFQRCVEEPFCAIRTVRGYMDLGNGLGDCDNNGVVDCRDLVLTHVYGRYSCVDKPGDKRVIRMMECLKASGHRDALSPRPLPATTPAPTPAPTPATTPTSTPTSSPTPPGTTPRHAGFFFNTSGSTYASSYASTYAYGDPGHVRGAPDNGYRSSDNAYGAPRSDFSGPNNAFSRSSNPSGRLDNAYGASGNAYGASGNAYGASDNAYGAPKNVYGAPDKMYGVPRSDTSGPNNAFGRYSNPYGSLDKYYSAPNNAYGGLNDALGRSNHPAGSTVRLSAPRRSFDSLSPCVDCRSSDGGDLADPEEIMSRLPKMTHGRLVM